MSEKHETKLQRVKELIELMKENDLVELEIEDGDSKISLKIRKSRENQSKSEVFEK